MAGRDVPAATLPATAVPSAAAASGGTTTAVAAASRRRGLSLRWRLTLWNVAILTCLLLFFGLVVFVFFVISLNREVDESLEQQYKQIRDGAGFYLDWDRGRGLRLFTDLRPDRFGTDQLDVFIQIASLDGKVPEGGRSANLGQLPLPTSTEALQAAREGRSWVENVEVAGQPMRLLSGPFYINLPGNPAPDPIGVIQVARSLDRIERTLALLQILLLTAGLVSLSVAAAAGLGLAGAALRPVDRLAQAARDIGISRDFSRRVPPAPNNDEIGQLAHTFNEMLAQLQTAHVSLAHSLEAQRRFVADASHELRTPLTTIRGNVGLLRRVSDVAPADRDAALADIESETDRMARLVTRLLSLARADAGATIRPLATDTAAIVRDAGRQLELLASAHGLAARCTADDAPLALADGDALRQVLLVLFDNAVNYTPPPGLVELQHRAGIDGIEIVVRDTGIGVAPEHHERIFERFFRVDPARSGGGAGLGLAIARFLVDAQGGRLTVSSSLGQGSTFRLWLPAATNG